MCLWQKLACTLAAVWPILYTPCCVWHLHLVLLTRCTIVRCVANCPSCRGKWEDEWPVSIAASSNCATHTNMGTVGQHSYVPECFWSEWAFWRDITHVYMWAGLFIMCIRSLNAIFSVSNMSWREFSILISADVHVSWDSVLPSSSDMLPSTGEGKPLPPLPPNQNSFLFTVTVEDVVSYPWY